MDRAAAATDRRIALGIILQAPEVRLHIRITPARAPLVTPAVVLFRIAAHEQIAVDGAGAADDAAAHPALRIVVEVDCGSVWYCQV